MDALLLFPTVARGVFRGAMDSANVISFLKYCIRDPVIWKRFAECAMLNTIFIVSLWMILGLVAPLQPTGAFATVWEALFSLLWVVPMYAVTQILGIAWYEEMYQCAVRIKYTDKGRSCPPQRDVSFVGISELLVKFIVTLLYGLLAACMPLFLPSSLLVVFGYRVPIGAAISFAMSAWLHSYYCFDYRFLQQGIVDKRTGRLNPVKLSVILHVFERHWSYYLGYGGTHIAMRSIMEYYEVPVFARLAVCSAVFSANVITSVDAVVSFDGDAAVPALPIFTPFYRLIAGAFANQSRKRQTETDVTTPPNIQE